MSGDDSRPFSIVIKWGRETATRKVIATLLNRETLGSRREWRVEDIHETEVADFVRVANGAQQGAEFYDTAL